MFVTSLSPDQGINNHESWAHNTALSSAKCAAMNVESVFIRVQKDNNLQSL